MTSLSIFRSILLYWKNPQSIILTQKKLDGSANQVSIMGLASNEKLDETPDICSSGLVVIDHVDVIRCRITGSALNQKLDGNPCFSSSGSDSSKLIDPADLQPVNDIV
ncbi:hypothetical protein Droror1_Dr00019758 [Drosera rotundifolia]